MATPIEDQKVFLLDRLGGEAALSDCVEIFYDRIVADERLTKFYEGASIARLRQHQKKFLKIAFTEIPPDMDMADYMISKHARLFQTLDLNETHFDIIAGHLVAALQKMEVPTPLIDEVVAIVGPLRDIFANEAERIRVERMEN